MKILYLSEMIKAKSGGEAVCKRNLFMLKQIFFGEHNRIFEYYITRKRKGILYSVYDEIVNKNIYGMTKADMKEVLDLIKNESITMVFIENSNNGFLCRTIKQNNPFVEIVVFFHNVEYMFMQDQLRLTRHPKFLFRIWISRLSERYVVRYANKIICLNNRDSQIIKKIYNRIPDAVIPVSLPDDNSIISYNNNDTVDSDSNVPMGLFVGSYFPPNVSGIIEFINKVMPKIKMKLVVAGSGMDLIAERVGNIPNVEIKGFVENLKELYASADFMVMPIFKGSGMKVKTAEALKYGKFLIASKESLIGYEISNNEAIECPTIESFVNAINNFKKRNKWNQSSRDLFLNKYSYNATLSSFYKVFN